MVINIKSAPKLRKNKSTNFNNEGLMEANVPVYKSTLHNIVPQTLCVNQEHDKSSILANSGRMKGMSDVEEIFSIAGSNEENSEGKESVVLARLH